MSDPQEVDPQELLAREQQALQDNDAESHHQVIEEQQAAGMDMRRYRFSRDDDDDGEEG